MEVSELPVWAQQASAIILALGTGVALQWAERRKKRAPEPEEPAGAATVVAAYFFDRKLVEALTAQLGRVEHELVEMNSHLDRAAHARHDEKIAREAAAAALAARGISQHG